MHQLGERQISVTSGRQGHKSPRQLPSSRLLELYLEKPIVTRPGWPYSQEYGREGAG